MENEFWGFERCEQRANCHCAIPFFQSHFCQSGFLTDAEQRSESFFAGAGKIDDAAAGGGIARGPVQFGETVHDGGAERAGEMMTALAPVEAGLAHRTARVG